MAITSDSVYRSRTSEDGSADEFRVCIVPGHWSAGYNLVDWSIDDRRFDQCRHVLSPNNSDLVKYAHGHMCEDEFRVAYATLLDEEKRMVSMRELYAMSLERTVCVLDNFPPNLGVPAYSAILVDEINRRFAKE